MQHTDTFRIIHLDMVLTLSKPKKIPHCPLQGLCLIQIAFLKDCQKLLLDTKPGGYLWKQNKTKRERERKKKGKFFAKQMGLAVILKKLSYGSAQ